MSDEKSVNPAPPVELTPWGLFTLFVSCMAFGINAGAVLAGLFFGLAVVLSSIFKTRFEMKGSRQLIWAAVITGALYLPGRAGLLIPRTVADSANSPGVYYLGIFCMAMLLVKAYRIKKQSELYTAYVISLALTLMGGLYAPWKWNLTGGILFILYSIGSLLIFVDLAILSHRTAPGSLPLSKGQCWPLYVAVPFTTALCVIAGLSSMRFESRLLMEMMKRFNPPTFYSFGHTVELGQVETLMQSRRVAIRINTRRPHSLVRGRIYNIYRKGGWVSESPAGPASRLAPSAFAVGGLDLPAYSMAKDIPIPPGGLSLADEYRVSIRKNNLIYHREGSFGAAVSGGEPTVDSLGNMWTFFGGALEYSVASSSSAEKSGELALLNPPGPEDLQIPDNLKEKFASFSLNISPDEKDPYRLAFAVEQYLQKNYTYQRGIKLTRRDMDPVEEFLFLKRPAHCEYYASAMTLLLRSRGIPARYVAGFSAHEYNRPGGYYLLRDMDAHAWVSVWIDKKGWTAFDPTPPSGRPDALPRQGDDWVDYLTDRAEVLWNLLKKGSLREFFAGLFSVAAKILSGGGGFMLLSVFLGVLGYVLFKKLTAEKPGDPSAPRQIPDEGPSVRKLQRMMAVFDEKLKKAGINRPKHLTLRESVDFINRTLTEADSEKPILIDGEACGSFLLTYSRLRYAGMEVGEDELKTLEETINGIFGN